MEDGQEGCATSSWQALPPDGEPPPVAATLRVEGGAAPAGFGVRAVPLFEPSGVKTQMQPTTPHATLRSTLV